MAEVINPAIVPKVTLPSGEQVPCVGMGTFGSTVYPQRMYLQLLQARSAVATVCLTVPHATETSMRSDRYLRTLLTKVL